MQRTHGSLEVAANMFRRRFYCLSTLANDEVACVDLHLSQGSDHLAMSLPALWVSNPVRDRTWH